MNSERKNAICDFIMNGALYSKIELSVDEKIEISNITSLLSGLDLYCSNCRANKTFIYKEKSTNRLMGYFQRTPNSNAYYDDIISITYLCPSCFKKIYVEFLFIDNSMMKIAQYPSLSDVSRDELKQFQKSKIIDPEYFKEIQKANVCAGEGYFVAAFTYMRRVFENLIKNIFKDNQTEIGLDYAEFVKKRTDDKIKIIKDYLPIDDDIYNPLFSLLSEGIHSLTEEECADSFKLLYAVLLDLLATFKARKEQNESRKKVKDLFAKRKAEKLEG